MEDIRNPECVKQWPDCVEGEYNPMCCRFPKSCSCEVANVRKEQDKTPANTYKSKIRRVDGYETNGGAFSPTAVSYYNKHAVMFVSDDETRPNVYEEDQLHTLGLSIINKLKEQIQLGPELGKAVGVVVNEFSKAGIVIDPLEIVKPTEQ